MRKGLLLGPSCCSFSETSPIESGRTTPPRMPLDVLHLSMEIVLAMKDAVTFQEGDPVYWQAFINSVRTADSLNHSPLPGGS